MAEVPPQAAHTPLSRHVTQSQTRLAAEEVPFFGPDLYAAYGAGSHATFVKPKHSSEECLVDYEPLKLSSFKVFFIKRGTIFQNPVLWTEQFLITLIFIGFSLPVYWYFRSEVHSSDKKGADVSVRRFIREQEGKMRAFASIMTGLAAFLLSFYTSITVTRWWAMRAGGVGAIKAATVDLQMLLYQCVTREEQVLSAVRRYGRASLLLIFLWRRQEIDNMKEHMTKHEILNESECDQLLKWKHCYHETIWAWQTGIVTRLHRQGKIKSDQMYGLLLQKCLDGRSAAQLVHTHLAVRVPMQYVHLLGLLVKMHNMVLAVIMGLLFGAAFRNGHYILCIQLFGRTLILPFLFNAILLINCDLSDPFETGTADFPGEIYQEALDKDCVGILGATQNMPDWLQEGFEDSSPVVLQPKINMV